MLCTTTIGCFTSDAAGIVTVEDRSGTGNVGNLMDSYASIVLSVTFIPRTSPAFTCELTKEISGNTGLVIKGQRKR